MCPDNSDVPHVIRRLIASGIYIFAALYGAFPVLNV